MGREIQVVPQYKITVKKPPRTEPLRYLGARVTPAEYAIIRMYAQREGLTLADVVRRAVITTAYADLPCTPENDRLSAEIYQVEKQWMPTFPDDTCFFMVDISATGMETLREVAYRHQLANAVESVQRLVTDEGARIAAGEVPKSAPPIKQPDPPEKQTVVVGGRTYRVTFEEIKP